MSVWTIPDGADARELGIARLPEIVVYHDDDFGGPSIRTNLSCVYFSQDDGWNDEISSIIVVSGTWTMFTDKEYGGDSVVLKPGYYPNMASIQMQNDTISSFRGSF